MAKALSAETVRRYKVGDKVVREVVLGADVAVETTQTARRIVVLGGTGHVGSYLCPLLASDPNNYVICISRGQSKPYPALSATFRAELAVHQIGGGLLVHKDALEVVAPDGGWQFRMRRAGPGHARGEHKEGEHVRGQDEARAACARRHFVRLTLCGEGHDVVRSAREREVEAAAARSQAPR